MGAVNSSNAIAGFSNRAGTVQNFYLVAPGVGIVTTDIGGGTTTVNGTSYSAPHVAGAVALTRQRFPALSATQVVNALLAAATDLGAAGTDAIFGRGLLNVSAALAPLGATSLPAAASEAEEARAMAALGASDMKLGAAFGDSIALALAATPAIVVDSYDRAFIADLSGYVHPPNARPDLAVLLDTGARPRTFSANIAAQSTLSLTFGDGPDETSELASHFAETPGDGSDLEPPAVRLAVGLGRGTDLVLGFATRLTQDADAVRRAGISFVSADLVAPPVTGMAGTGNTFVLRQRLGRRTRIRFATAVGTQTFAGGYGTRGRSAATLDIERGLESGASLGAHAGVLHEEGSFLDTVSSGAFEAAEAARTGFFGVSASLPLPSVDRDRALGLGADRGRGGRSRRAGGLLAHRQHGVQRRSRAPGLVRAGRRPGARGVPAAPRRGRLGPSFAARGVRLRDRVRRVRGWPDRPVAERPRGGDRALVRAQSSRRRGAAGQPVTAFRARPRRRRRARDHRARAAQARLLAAAMVFRGKLLGVALAAYVLAGCNAPPVAESGADALPEGAIALGESLYMVPAGVDDTGCPWFRAFSPTKMVVQAMFYRAAEGGFVMDKSEAVCTAE